ncbi:TetR/AcrR family transcriptional regulator [Sediminibacillus albus]|uniref:DNA-binding transcriptional regulator, AcrR family n=1 Tax=Sediminibacillus albus TaxID=407036 RepID=A0A1G8X1V7_9BACI|nr:TetR/AcrR family transcriptional regulator [Sediminibacillus albus]SDJ84424.1 DNA-binding transcriptional regulator, AcrR family [Sediminibacillus albus]
MPLSEQQLQNMNAKREKILEQAITLFSGQGYNDTTISKVAKASGVSFGSVFTYFPTKEDLFHHAVTDRLDEYATILLNFTTEAEDPVAELENMVNTHIKLFSSVGTYLRLIAQVIGQHQRFQRQFTELDTFHDQFRYKIAKLVENGQEKGLLNSNLQPIYAATSYSSFLMGLRLNLIDGPEHDVWDAFKPFAMQLFGPNTL